LPYKADILTTDLYLGDGRIAPHSPNEISGQHWPTSHSQSERYCSDSFTKIDDQTALNSVKTANSLFAV
jgi:hypothetical protein